MPKIIAIAPADNRRKRSPLKDLATPISIFNVMLISSDINIYSNAKPPPLL